MLYCITTQTRDIVTRTDFIILGGMYGLFLLFMLSYRQHADSLTKYCTDRGYNYARCSLTYDKHFIPAYEKYCIRQIEGAEIWTPAEEAR